MKVLVTGGTGFIGRHLCTELLDRDHDVTALSRTPDSDVVPPGVEVAMGDVTARDSLTEAFRDSDAVINLVSPSPLFEPKGGNEMYDRVHRVGTENCLEVAETHEVRRFVQISGLGVDPNGPTHYLRAKGRAEELVRAADVDWTIFRPSVVFGDGDEFVGFTRMLTPPLLAPLPGGGSTRFQPIYVKDVVEMIADALEDNAHVGEVYEIGGPEVLTLANVAKLARNARGHPVRILPMPMALAKVGLTIMGAIPGVPMGPDQYRSLQLDNTVADNDIAAFGVSEDELVRLAEYLDVDAG